MKPVYRPSEVARLAGVSVHTIYRLIGDKILVAVNMPGRRNSRRPTYRIYRVDLIVFLKERGMSDVRIQQILS